MHEPPVSRLAVVVCLVMLVLGLAGVVMAWGAYFVDAGLVAHGPRAKAVVLKKEFLRAADGDSDHLVTYRFEVPDGAPVTSQRGLGQAQWTELDVGDELVIVYSATDPQRNFPEGAGVTSIAAPILFTVVFGAVAALGAAALVGLTRRTPAPAARE